MKSNTITVQKVKISVIFLTFFCIGSFYNVFSQKSASTFFVGLRAMPQISFIYNADDYSAQSAYKPKLTFGYGGGFVFGDYFKKNFGFEIGVLVSRQGQLFGIKDVYLDSLIQLDYVKLPAMFKFCTNRTKRVQFTAMFGPQLAFLYNVTRTLNGSKLGDQVFSQFLEYKDLYNPVDISLVLALGVDVRLIDNLYLNALVRSDLSVIDAEDKTLKLPGRADSRVSTIGLTLGLSYLFDKTTKRVKMTPPSPPMNP